MFKGKIYEYLKKYFDEYLFGFDKRQLDVALLSGGGFDSSRQCGRQACEPPP